MERKIRLNKKNTRKDGSVFKNRREETNEKENTKDKNGKPKIKQKV